MIEIVLWLQGRCRHRLVPSLKIEDIVNECLKIPPTFFHKMNSTLGAIIPIASTCQDAAHTIDEVGIIIQPFIHKLFQLSHVFPLGFWVREGLNAIYPIEQPYQKFHFGKHPSCELRHGLSANNGGVGTKIDTGVATWAAVRVGLLSQVVIDPTQTAGSLGHDGSATPVAASLEGDLTKGAGIGHASYEFDIVSVPITRIVLGMFLGHALEWRRRLIKVVPIVLLVIVLWMRNGRNFQGGGIDVTRNIVLFVIVIIHRSQAYFIFIQLAKLSTGIGHWKVSSIHSAQFAEHTPALGYASITIVQGRG
mmetsp:Transcript_9667/g.20955  ORF Transcript_9667/g.20955 Transcript_9667/m.20955 type:complete len:307 (+) Transcript_9667:774-1694(+)